MEKWRFENRHSQCDPRRDRLTRGEIGVGIGVMGKRAGEWWESNVMMAAAILHDRGMRRRALSGFVVLLLAMFAFGLWVIDGWLTASLWRFAIWWGACFLLALFIVLFAFLDVVAVVREERERFQSRMRGEDPDSSCDDE